MFACIHAPGINASAYSKLVKLASGFSPLLETTTPDSVLLDLRGSEMLYDPFTDLPGKIEKAGLEIGLEIRAAIAGNPDAAFHAAHGLKKSVYIEPGKESESLGNLRLETIVPELAGVTQERLGEIVTTLHNWGIYKFEQLAGLPECGISERLGPEGVRIQRLASGRSNRSIAIQVKDSEFSRSIDLEFPIALQEPLFFILHRFIKELIECIRQHSLAAAGLQIRMGLENGLFYERRVQFPIPIREIKTLQRIIELEISASPPSAAVSRIELLMQPGKIRGTQSGLFVPGGPEPEKTELILARIGRMIGLGKNGSPEIQDSHRPDAFHMKHFQSGFIGRKKNKRKLNGFWNDHSNPVFARIMRPPLRSSVCIQNNQPVRVNAPGSRIREGISGKVVLASGPWYSSGEWWTEDSWEREEWDIQLDQGLLCRIYRDLKKDLWFVDAIYD